MADIKEGEAFLGEPEEKVWVTSPYSKKKQILATLCATLGCLLNGSVIGYTGPAIPSLTNTTGERAEGEIFGGSLLFSMPSNPAGSLDFYLLAAFVAASWQGPVFSTWVAG